ncbi:MAG TPA: helix-turn-helix domain-containing protein [Nitrosomonas sp.]|nr:helix-turn-helix domain-containing protein [Nitrosomonas sp.]HNC41252.1 helix-turn-helix domain-containing protein [Nitrosomonas sp.]HNH69768.1 helix-turn-helix domain-containing protein [Nitrosomonas sp.]
MNLVGKIIETYVGVDGNESLALGKRLQRLRKLAGLTQADFSHRLKISEGALSRLEKRTDIHVSTVKQYVEALGAKLQISAAFSTDNPIAFRIIEAFDAELINEKQLLLPIFDDDVFRPQRDVVLSIKPQYSSKILKGTKTIELRRRFPIDVPQGTLAFIYSTTPEKALIGYTEIVSVTKESVSNIWRSHKIEACISKRDFESYFSGQDFGFALRFRSAKPFKQAIDLTELRERFGFEPPQSFLYVKPELREALRHELLAEISY